MPKGRRVQEYCSGIKLTLCDDILEVDQNIRFVAHLDKRMEFVEMKQRPGVKSLTEQNADKEFFSFVEPIVLSVFMKFRKGFGELRSIRVKYENISIVFLSIPGAILGLTMEPGPTTPVIEKIGKKYGVDYGTSPTKSLIRALHTLF